MTPDQLREFQELAAAAAKRAGKATPGPWGTCIYEEATAVDDVIGNLRHGSGDVWGAWCPRHPKTVGTYPCPDHAVMPAITGNGTDSESNADFIASARQSMPALSAAVNALLDEVERLRGVARQFALRAAYQTKRSQEAFMNGAEKIINGDLE
jgi:hypothetical protein